MNSAHPEPDSPLVEIKGYNPAISKGNVTHFLSLAGSCAAQFAMQETSLALMYQPDKETWRNAIQYWSINRAKFATPFDISVKQMLNNALLKARRKDWKILRYWALLNSTLIFNLERSWFCGALACIQSTYFYGSCGKLFHIDGEQCMLFFIQSIKSN